MRLRRLAAEGARLAEEFDRRLLELYAALEEYGPAIAARATEKFGDKGLPPSCC